MWNIRYLLVCECALIHIIKSMYVNLKGKKVTKKEANVRTYLDRTLNNPRKYQYATIHQWCMHMDFSWLWNGLQNLWIVCLNIFSVRFVFAKNADKIYDGIIAKSLMGWLTTISVWIFGKISHSKTALIIPITIYIF